MKLMLIGGGEIGRGKTLYETKEIDEEIVKMSGKDKPNFLFIGLASQFADSYYDYIKKIYKNLGCDTVYLKKKNVINNPDIVENKIKNADIIYIGGGDTIKLMNTIKEYGIDKLLMDAIANNTVVAGISAGAILLSEKGFSDSLLLRGESDRYEFIDGLGVVPVNICPHYNSSDKKKEDLIYSLKQTPYDFYGLENCTALKVIDNDFSLIKSKKEANMYLCHYDDGLIEKIVK